MCYVLYLGLNFRIETQIDVLFLAGNSIMSLTKMFGDVFPYI